MIYGLDLFAGYGGANEALAGYVRTVAYCEVEPGAQRILLRRMQKGEIDHAPIWDDVRTLQGHYLGSPIDIITGGWPCTDISCAGTRSGLGGSESRLFWEIARLTRELRPSYLFLENSPMLLCDGYGFDAVLGELAAQGYDVQWGVLSAAAVGAPHRRDRVWILAAHPDRIRVWDQQELKSGGSSQAVAPSVSEERYAADAEVIRCREGRPELQVREGEPTTAGSGMQAPGTAAYADKIRRFRQEVYETEERLPVRYPPWCGQSALGAAAHAEDKRLEGRLESWQVWQAFTVGGGSDGGGWPHGVPEPTIRRLDDGAARKRAGTIRRISISAGGNGWVIPCAREAFKRLIGLK